MGSPGRVENLTQQYSTESDVRGRQAEPEPGGARVRITGTWAPELERGADETMRE